MILGRRQLGRFGPYVLCDAFEDVGGAYKLRGYAIEPCEAFGIRSEAKILTCREAEALAGALLAVTRSFSVEMLGAPAELDREEETGDAGKVR